MRSKLELYHSDILVTVQYCGLCSDKCQSVRVVSCCLIRGIMLFKLGSGFGLVG